jgi:hypothetical protein
MPRYHFNVVLGDKLIGDQVGQTCPDLEAAHHRASSIAREMLGSPRVYGVQWSEAVFYIVVDGQEIATMAFSESAKHLR